MIKAIFVESNEFWIPDFDWFVGGQRIHFPILMHLVFLISFKI